jgi:hypothetical protein
MCAGSGRDPCHKGMERASTRAFMVARADRLGLFPIAPRQAKCDRMGERRKSVEEVERQRRLRAALRENLKRRKAQAKGRVAAAGGAEKPHDSAGIVGDKRKS